MAPNSFFRLLCGIWLVLFPLFSKSQPTHARFDDLLKRHVRSNGEVDYKSLKKDASTLNAYLDELKRSRGLTAWSLDQRLAFYINAYNAFTLKVIVDRYPIESIKDLNPLIAIPGYHTVWTKKFIDLDGQKLSLDDIEHNILRKQFNDPRIHFAINCASRSCPHLRSEAYVAGKINVQLEDQAKRFINNRTLNIITPDHINCRGSLTGMRGILFEREH